MNAKIHVKNMVCPRCIAAVKDALESQNIGFERVELGTVYLKNPLTESEKHSLQNLFSKQGFELLESEKSALISQIKSLIIQQIHHSKDPLQVNFSTFLSEKLNQEYTSLSRLFSSVEGITIEKFITKHKIERIKELLIYDEMSLSELADLMDYSSVAYLSSQFKKETGMTPSEFKKDTKPFRGNLDRI